LALWELGITPESALAVEGSERGLRTASAAGLPTMLVTNGDGAGHEFTDAAAVRSSYAGGDPLSAAGCRQLHRRWLIQQKRSQAA
ncbi:MAG TPA: haloacid dehalogenase, partial [Mycobacterium sp.]|nr:haloacid dehalogenase [Mycobacterium sp.]